MNSAAPRLVALDLDGTLLDPDKNVSEANLAALRRAAAAGAAIVPATGRFFGMMPEAVRSLPFVRYAITVNGAEVYDRETDSAVARDEIPLADAVRIMEMLDRHDVIYDCYRSDWGWMQASMQERAEEYAPDRHYLKLVREFRKPVPDLKKHLLETASEGGVQKVMAFARKDDPEARELAAIRREAAELFDGLSVTSAVWNDIEFNAAAANKGRALERLAAHLGIPLRACLAFGDGLNDVTMLEAAGTGVAMGNAPDEVKRRADAVTASNAEDGVARFLEKIFPA